MRRTTAVARVEAWARAGRCGLIGVLLVGGLLAGCARTLTIRQDPYINTAPHENRPPDKQTGEPLELSVVVVYPDDLKKPGNEQLRPESKITAKDWYTRRPQVDVGAGGGRFDLPRNQIYVLSNDGGVFGRLIGNALRGAALDGEKPIRKTAIGLKPGAVHNDETVIYVFPKFVDRDGEVLPVPPAKFRPPGAYRADLEVKIGVHPNRPLKEAQYIQLLSERKLHGPER